MFKFVSELSPPEIYRYLVGAIVPRPIAWISTQNAEGVQNLAPYSFFTVASVNPPVLAVTHIPSRTQAEKDTLKNLRTNPQCVINIVSANQIQQANASSQPLANNESEFKQFDITSTPSQQVEPVSVADSKVRYECKLRDLVSISAGGQLILLDLIGVFVDDNLIKDGLIDSAQLDAVGKMGGDDYNLTRELIKAKRPD
ncbi:flavin reductase family protein [Thiomicrospira pelophila]|uniref:flavin reductase family protein n=1 Tax=Thiomicrospira pelophila TaxID=934 RepID=UPI0004A6F1D7|nr:flavin reductase family protein [Thiomicrospira pelophila]